jgi:two-component system chemotaxis response regulator CheY
MKVLIVDDSRAMRMLLKRLLVSVGFDECLEAGDGLQALAVLETSGPLPLALVDWNMPEMNGLEFVTAVRAKAAYADMRLMMVTTETELEQVQQALAAGANEYMMKPFTADVLRDKLQLLGLISETG